MFEQADVETATEMKVGAVEGSMFEDPDEGLLDGQVLSLPSTASSQTCSQLHPAPNCSLEGSPCTQSANFCKLLAEDLFEALEKLGTNSAPPTLGQEEHPPIVDACQSLPEIEGIQVSHSRHHASIGTTCTNLLETNQELIQEASQTSIPACVLDASQGADGRGFSEPLPDTQLYVAEQVDFMAEMSSTKPLVEGMVIDSNCGMTQAQGEEIMAGTVGEIQNEAPFPEKESQAAAEAVSAPSTLLACHVQAVVEEVPEVLKSIAAISPMEETAVKDSQGFVLTVEKQDQATVQAVVCPTSSAASHIQAHVEQVPEEILRSITATPPGEATADKKIEGDILAAEKDGQAVEVAVSASSSLATSHVQAHVEEACEELLKSITATPAGAATADTEMEGEILAVEKDGQTVEVAVSASLFSATSHVQAHVEEVPEEALDAITATSPRKTTVDKKIEGDIIIAQAVEVAASDLSSSATSQVQVVVEEIPEEVVGTITATSAREERTDAAASPGSHQIYYALAKAGGAAPEDNQACLLAVETSENLESTKMQDDVLATHRVPEVPEQEGNEACSTALNYIEGTQNEADKVLGQGTLHESVSSPDLVRRDEECTTCIDTTMQDAGTKSAEVSLDVQPVVEARDSLECKAKQQDAEKVIVLAGNTSTAISTLNSSEAATMHLRPNGEERHAEDILKWLNVEATTESAQPTPAKAKSRNSFSLPLKRSPTKEADEDVLDMNCNKKRVRLTPGEVNSELRALTIGDMNRIIAECFNLQQPMQAVKIFRAMRSAQLIPTSATFEMFRQALYSCSLSDPAFLDAFASDIKDAMEGTTAMEVFFMAMPKELPVEMALIACNTHHHALCLSLLDTVFSASRRTGSLLPSSCQPNNALDAHLRSSVALKKGPMQIDEMISLGLLPSSPTSDLWSVAISAHALAEDPRAAFEIIDYMKLQSYAAISMDAETDACSSAVCNGLVAMCIRRLETLSEQAGGLTIEFCNTVLSKIVRFAAGRLDMGTWADVMRIMHNCGVDFDVETHKLTLYAALAAKDLVICREAFNLIHTANGEVPAEVEQAIFDLQEQERLKKQSRSMMMQQGKSGEDEQTILNLSNLNGKDSEQYLRFMCTAIGRRRADIALDAWQLLIERCGVKAAQEIVEPCVFTLCEAGQPREALQVMEVLRPFLPAGEVVRISSDTFQKAMRQSVVAPRETLTTARGWQSDAKALHLRVELLEQWLDAALASRVCSQDLFTSAAQGFYALSEMGASMQASLGGSIACVDGVDQLMGLLEKMRTCNISPSAESYSVLISAAGFMLRDPSRVRELMTDMGKVGLEVPDTAHEALCAALALTGEAKEAVTQLEILRAGGASITERSVEAVVQGLVNDGEPSGALEFVRRIGSSGDAIKMCIFRGFITSGELDRAIELYNSVQGAAPELPPKFQDLMKALRGGD